MKIQTLQEMWHEYKTACYPNGIGGVQNMECHQAFMAGVLSMLAELEKITDLPEGEAVKEVAKLHAEAERFAKAKIDE